VLLDLAGRTELVEGALRHAREDVDHGVDSILLKFTYQLLHQIIIKKAGSFLSKFAGLNKMSGEIWQLSRKFT